MIGLLYFFNLIKSSLVDRHLHAIKKVIKHYHAGFVSYLPYFVFFFIFF